MEQWCQTKWYLAVSLLLFSCFQELGIGMGGKIDEQLINSGHGDMLKSGMIYVGTENKILTVNQLEVMV